MRSIVGRYLEHTRIFYFYHQGQRLVYLSSADWMYRNFFKRIEICFPILDAKVKKRVIKEGLDVYLKDNINSWIMSADGSYYHRAKRGKALSAQEFLMHSMGEEFVS